MKAPRQTEKDNSNGYNVHISQGKGITIGDYTHVEQHFGISQRSLLTLLGIALILILLATAWFVAKPFYFSTSFPFIESAKQVALQEVEKLDTPNYSPGVSITRYESIFGNPTITSQNVQKGIIEYIYVTPYFYLDLVAANDANLIATNTSTVANMVLYSAVTIRDLTFNPKFASTGYPSNQPSFQVALGKTTFENIEPTSGFIGTGALFNNLTICVGANWFSYYETYYFGRPGDYRQFAVGLNEQGLGDTGYYKSFQSYASLLKSYNIAQSCPAPPAPRPAYTDRQLRQLETMRKSVPINTYAESAPGIQIDHYMPLTNELGVSQDMVR